MTNTPDRARTQVPRGRRAVDRRQSWIYWGIAALLICGATAAVLLITAQPTAPARGSGGETSSGAADGGAPTGARIDITDPLAVGDCVEIVPLPPDHIELLRADCADATFALDAVQPRCPDHGKTVTRDGVLGWCFTWLVSSGDCLDTARNARITCDTPAPDDGAHRTYLKIVAVRGGERDGARCPDPHRYLLAGRGKSRGVACYDLVEPRTQTRIEPRIEPQSTPRREPTAWAATAPSSTPHRINGRAGVRGAARAATIEIHAPTAPVEPCTHYVPAGARGPQTVPDQVAVPSSSGGSRDRRSSPAPRLVRTDTAPATHCRAERDIASPMTPAGPRCSTGQPPPADVRQREPQHRSQHEPPRVPCRDERGTTAEWLCQPDRGRHRPSLSDMDCGVLLAVAV